MANSPRLAKLTRPRSSGLLKRERLFEQLDHACESARIVWIAAQPGAGKTSLLSSYLATRKLKGIWYQCDSVDQDLASFFYFMGQALTQATPRKKPFSMPLTPEYLPSLPIFIRRYLREFTARLPQPFLVVIDNFQDGASAGLSAVLDIACEEVPPGSCFIVASRVGPPGELARHIANQHLALIDARELRLTVDETSEIVSHEKSISAETIKVIHD